MQRREATTATELLENVSGLSMAMKGGVAVLQLSAVVDLYTRDQIIRTLNIAGKHETA